MQEDRAHTEVSATEINSQVKTLYQRESARNSRWKISLPSYLFCAIWHRSHESRDLAQGGALFGQALVRLLDVLGNPALHFLGGVVEVTRNARSLVQ